MVAKKKVVKKIAVKKGKKSVAKPKKVRAAAALKGPKKKRSEQPTSGQSGPPLDLVKAKLNDKEEKVVAVLLEDANPVPINALATNCFSDKSAGQANSWVRNSLRRLVRAKWAEKVGKGTYRLTSTGKARAEGAAAPESKPSEPAEETAAAPTA